jgi:ABC-2 type transport system ATP-binding protein
MLHNKGCVQDILIELVDEVNEDDFKLIPNVLNITRVEGKTWLLSSNSEEDIRPAIFRYCVEKGYTILTLKQKSRQMEEVFQTLTQINS